MWEPGAVAVAKGFPGPGRPCSERGIIVRIKLSVCISQALCMMTLKYVEGWHLVGREFHEPGLVCFSAQLLRGFVVSASLRDTRWPFYEAKCHTHTHMCVCVCIYIHTHIHIHIHIHIDTYTHIHI